MTAAAEASGNPNIEIVNMLTRVALRRNNHGYPCDFVAQVLAATAANAGGPDQLLAGRACSWEKEHLGSLLTGTMGDRPQDWLRFRTEPLAVPLNVAQLIQSGDQHPGLLRLDDAIAAVENRYAATDDDQELKACGAEVDAVTAGYTVGYRSYTERFMQAVEAAAADLGLPVRVAVKVDDDPHSAWWTTKPAVSNPAMSGGDPLTFSSGAARTMPWSLPTLTFGWTDPFTSFMPELMHPRKERDS